MLGTMYRDLRHLLTNRYYLINYCIPWLYSILQEPEWDTRMAYLSYHIGGVRVHSLIS